MSEEVFISDLDPDYSKSVDHGDHHIKISNVSQKVKVYIKNLLTERPNFTGCVEIYFKDGDAIEAKRPEKTKL